MSAEPSKKGSILLYALGAVVTVAVAAMASRRGRALRKVDAELRRVALVAMPPIIPALVPLMQRAVRARKAVVPAGVSVEEHWVRSRFGGPDVRVVQLQRAAGHQSGPALLWLHGGGYLIGTPEIDFNLLARVLGTIDVTIFSVDYRLAPDDPFPAALDDAMSVLEWLAEQREMLGVDLRRIAVGGNSAGGGLAAALAQRAHDENVSLAFQLLMYPMLDDRTTCRLHNDGRGELVWTPRENRHGWRAYLGYEAGGNGVPPYAAPARRERLEALAPAWIGVGSLDLFYEEDIRYGERLRLAGVPCETRVVPDAPHAFDLFSFETPTTRAFHNSMIAALAAAYEATAALQA